MAPILLSSSYLFRHASLSPFLVGAGDVLLVGQKFAEFATDDSRVVVAGDFAVEFIEWDIAEVAVLSLDFGGGFGEFGFGSGFRVGVFFVGGGIAGRGFGGFGFGVGGDTRVVVFGGESLSFRHGGCILDLVEVDKSDRGRTMGESKY